MVLDNVNNRHCIINSHKTTIRIPEMLVNQQHSFWWSKNMELFTKMSSTYKQAFQNSCANLSALASTFFTAGHGSTEITIWRPVGRRFRRLNSLQLNRGFMVPVFFPDTFLSMKDFMKVTLWKPYKVTTRMFFQFNINGSRVFRAKI